MTVSAEDGERLFETLGPLPSTRFGEVIRQLRKSRGWSQERLAADAELNRSYMGQIERAHAIPTLATAEKLAHALRVPLSDLIWRCESASAVGAARRSLESAD